MNDKSRLFRPDGFGADAKPNTVKLHKNGVELPLPTTNGADLLPACMRDVTIQHPTLGTPMTVQQLAMTGDTALVLVETYNALLERDATIDALTKRIEALEQGPAFFTAAGDQTGRTSALTPNEAAAPSRSLVGDMSEPQTDDDFKKAKEDGYDGVG